MPKLILKCEGCKKKFEHYRRFTHGITKKFCEDCVRKKQKEYRRCRALEAKKRKKKS